MARVATQARVPDCAVPGFELERLAVEDGRVRVAGWWYGVRGRRFIRPSLTAIGGGLRARALAELEHKPWSAEDEQQGWLAEFVWEHPLSDVEAFELAVAPDLAVRIPLPALVPATKGDDLAARSGEDIAEPLDGRLADETASRTDRLTSAQRSPADGDGSSRAPVPITRAEGQRARALAARDAAVAERARLVEAHDRALAERDRLAEELGEALAASASAASERDALSDQRRVWQAERESLIEAHDRAVAEPDRLREQLGEALAASASVAADRDQAVTENRRLVDERDRALRERDAALALSERAGAERDALSGQRRAWQSERTGLIETRDQARAERNGLLAQYAQQRLVHERLTRERDEAVALSGQVAAERDRLREQRDVAVAERATTTHELDQARRERDEAVALAEQGAAERDRLREQRDAAVAERATTTHELDQARRERGTALADAQRLSDEREHTHDAHHAALLTAERAVAAAGDLERAKAAVAVDLNNARLSAERLMRERDAAIAKLTSLARSRPAAPDERPPYTQPQAPPGGAINSAPTRSHDMAGHPQRAPAPRSFVATPQLNLSQSLLSRVVALTAVIAVVVIMVAIVLWR